MASLPNGSQLSSIIFIQKYVTVSETLLFTKMNTLSDAYCVCLQGLGIKV